MSFAPETETPETEALARPEALLRVPVGLASPLWGLFAGAAMSGAAWWWMTRWTRVENLEAMFATAGKAQAAIEPQVEAILAPAVEKFEAVAEPRVETTEALAQGLAALEPVGGEAAPISVLVEELAPEAAPDAAAKPKKPSAPKPA